MTRAVVLGVACALLSAGAACGPKPDAAEGGGGGSAVVALPDVPFEQLDHQQRIAFMKQVVVPEMAPIFQRHDQQEFAAFGCKTCHGEGAERGEFHMPNDKLPKLNFADMSKFEQADIDWMKTEVKPAMARLLKEPEHSAETPQGFGCLHCHMQATE